MVVASIAARARSEAGRDLLIALAPCARLEDALAVQELHRDVLELQGTPDAPPAAEAPDVRPLLARLEVPGGLLRGEELWQLRLLLDAAGASASWLGRGRRAEETPGLERLLRPLDPLPALHRELGRALEPSGAVRDDASPDLARIRRSIRSLRERIAARLEALHRALGVAESFVTLREERYVLAVPASERRRVPGAAIGHSGSGATLFIEPREVAEASSELAERLLDESRETERILRALTAHAHRDRAGLAIDAAILARLDASQAVAAWARATRSALPELVAARSLVLVGARHPLLVERRLRGETGPPVPLDLDLDADRPMLVLTGPNMGGKTVALKTAGLLALVAMTGLPIPAEGGTRFGWFDRLIADIGDEQSILNDVSTFLSHLKQVAEAVDHATGESLVLLDELGSGTDPVEGAALGQAVLEQLLRRGTLTLAATHHGALKVFAHEASGVRNASMAFDEATHRPLFTLAVGVPGRSRALQVAERFGMDRAVLARATELLPQGERDLGSLLEELGRMRDRAASEREEVAALRGRLAEREGELKQALARLELERRERKQAELAARRELLRQLENQIDEYRKRLRTDRKAAASTLEEARGLARQVSDAIDAEAEPTHEAPAGGPVSSVAAGDRLYVPGLRTEAVALTAPDADGRVRVRVGGATAVLPLAQLRRRAEGRATVREPGRPLQAAAETPEARTEIDVRGYDAEEAIEAVGKFLEDAVVGGVERARIIHGKGKGVLRERMKRWLETNTLVKEFRLGEIPEGGTGVTIVTLQ